MGTALPRTAREVIPGVVFADVTTAPPRVPPAIRATGTVACRPRLHTAPPAREAVWVHPRARSLSPLLALPAAGTLVGVSALMGASWAATAVFCAVTGLALAGIARMSPPSLGSYRTAPAGRAASHTDTGWVASGASTGRPTVTATASDLPRVRAAITGRHAIRSGR